MLALSILDQRMARRDSVPAAQRQHFIEVAVYEARMALAGESLEAITQWHGLVA